MLRVTLAAKHYDIVDHSKKYKGDAHTFFLDMRAWRKFKTRYNLNWERVPFVQASRKLVPQEPGIYAFTAELTGAKLPQHGYILYVGITGDGASKANLQKRYTQYERDLKNMDGRPAVVYMLANWREDLMFNFVPMPNPKVDLKKLEAAFINSIMPPVNRRDFEPKNAAKRQAAF